MAESFADIFFSNCTKIGLLPVVLGGDDVRALMQAGEAEVDLEAREVRFDGRAVPFELDDDTRHRLLERARRHRPHAAAHGRHRGLRVGPRAARPRDHGAVAQASRVPPV